MAYVSMTLPGVTRGPHAHGEQADCIVVLTSRFAMALWDGRAGSPTRGNRMEVEMDGGRPEVLVIPPGVVHAYTNVGESEGLVMNFPNRLYGGWGRGGPVDEVRHEDDPESPYRVGP
jgi:dTDP-4-dehydrorhamnose 3,5-epimerase